MALVLVWTQAELLMGGHHCYWLTRMAVLPRDYIKNCGHFRKVKYTLGGVPINIRITPAAPRPWKSQLDICMWASFPVCPGAGASRSATRSWPAESQAQHWIRVSDSSPDALSSLHSGPMSSHSNCNLNVLQEVNRAQFFRGNQRRYWFFQNINMVYHPVFLRFSFISFICTL